VLAFAVWYLRCATSGVAPAPPAPAHLLLLTLQDKDKDHDLQHAHEEEVQISKEAWAKSFTSAGEAVIEQVQIEELYRDPAHDAQGDVELQRADLSRFSVKLHSTRRFKSVWNSHGTMSREKVGIWAPDMQTSTFKTNVVRVCLGHYAFKGFSKPNGRPVMEIADSSSMGKGRYIHALIDKILPMPVRFRQVWSQQRGKQQFFAWRPVPPSTKFAALGMVGTTTEAEPPRDCMRCVPRAWLVPSREPPVCVWDDRGCATGGVRGSIWSVTSSCLLHVKRDYAPPAEPTYELKAKSFRLDADTYAQIVSADAHLALPSPNNPAGN
jgi:hypothetical protein